MQTLITLFVNFTWILCPFIVFLIYEAYVENINNKQNKLILNFCLLTSIYLIIRFSTSINYGHIIEITFDTIILVLYLKKQYKSALFISIIGLIYLKTQLNFEIIIILFKYITYFSLYEIYKNKQKYYMHLTLVSRIIFMTTMIIITNIRKNELIEYIFYYVTTYIIIIFLIKAEKIIEIHISYKELMKEHQLKESLFKISHEIKNPIAVCKGYLDMYDTNNINQFKKYIPILKSEIDKTLNILKDFSEFSKIKIEPDIIDISVLIEDITNNFKLMFDSKNIKFEIEKIEDEIMIYGDYNRLNQVLLNIIKNSIEAQDNNKKSYIKIYTKQKKDIIKIFIEDNGVGISKENLKKISEPFFTTKQNGTGLGVLLSKEIITAHNGKLEYKSEEKKGTTAIISLPLYQ